MYNKEYWSVGVFIAKRLSYGIISTPINSKMLGFSAHMTIIELAFANCERHLK